MSVNDLNSGINTKVKVLASKDMTQDAKIQSTEAQISSIFTTNLQTKANALTEGLTNNDIKTKVIMAVNDIWQKTMDAFKEFGYDSQEVDSELADQQRAKIDAEVDKEIKTQAENLETQFNTAAEAKAKEFGVGRENAKDNFTTKGALSGKKGEKSEEYKAKRNEIEQLKKAGAAKIKYKEVNGQRAEIIIMNDNEYIIDDNGELQELVQTDKKRSFALKDDLEAAGALNEDGTVKDNYTLQTRRVDGKKQVIAVQQDDKHTQATVIGHDNISGEASNATVAMSDSRGKDKYSYINSGLTNNPDVEQRVNDRAGEDWNISPHDGAKVRTVQTEDGKVLTGNRARMNADVEGQGKAIKTALALVSDALASGADITADKGGNVVFKDGTTYTLKAITDSMTNKAKREAASENDTTLRNIYNHYQNNYQKQTFDREITNEAGEVTTENIDDRRSATRLVDGGANQDDTIAKTVPEQHYGSDYNDQGKTTLKENGTSGGAKPNVINYQTQQTEGGYQFTRQNFIDEGWKRSSDGLREKKILDNMRQTAQNDKTGQIKFTSATNVKEFTETFVRANYSETNQKFDIGKLANAIKVANPSFFDASGNMFKDVDFNRINFPSNIDAYISESEDAFDPSAPIVQNNAQDPPQGGGAAPQPVIPGGGDNLSAPVSVNPTEPVTVTDPVRNQPEQVQPTEIDSKGVQGSYSITTTEDGGYNINGNLSVTPDNPLMQKFSSTTPDVYDVSDGTVTVKKLGIEANGSDEKDARGELNNKISQFVSDHAIYMDLIAKQNDGTILSSAEQQFVKDHAEEMSKLDIKFDDNGNIIENQPEPVQSEGNTPQFTPEIRQIVEDARQLTPEATPEPPENVSSYINSLDLDEKIRTSLKNDPGFIENVQEWQQKQEELKNAPKFGEAGWNPMQTSEIEVSSAKIDVDLYVDTINRWQDGSIGTLPGFKHITSYTTVTLANGQKAYKCDDGKYYAPNRDNAGIPDENKPIDVEKLELYEI